MTDKPMIDSEATMVGRIAQSAERKRYECTCPACGCALYAAKSIAQRDFGLHDMGLGSCKCGAFLHLTFHPETDTMSAEPWDEFLAREVSGLV